MSNSSFIELTGQRWKINTFYAVTAALVITRLSLIWFMKNRDYWIDPLYMSIVMLDFAFLFFSIRCPTCKSYVAYHIFKTVSYRKTFSEIAMFNKCPCCNFIPIANKRSEY